MEKEPWVAGKSLLNLGEAGQGLRVCKVHELRHFYKRLDVIQRKREPLGGSQQARRVPTRHVPLLWLYVNFFFIPNVHLSLQRGFSPSCDKFSNFVMEAKSKWNSLYRNPFWSQLS